MPNRGKMVIVGIVAVALVAASFSAWYHYRGQQRAQQFWGTTSAVLIAGAPEVELMRLGEGHESNPDDDSEPHGDAEPPRALEFGELAWSVEETKDATGAKGINNVRRALVQDTTFDWRRPADESEPHWQYAVGFTDHRNWATVLFDVESARVALTGGKQPVSLDRSANEELKQFFAEQFPARKAADDTAPSADEKPADSPAAETPSAPTAPDADIAQPEAESK
jgi:hypothetical protein